jgi:hypothetical protein
VANSVVAKVRETIALFPMQLVKQLLVISCKNKASLLEVSGKILQAIRAPKSGFGPDDVATAAVEFEQALLQQRATRLTPIMSRRELMDSAASYSVAAAQCAALLERLHNLGSVLAVPGALAWVVLDPDWFFRMLALLYRSQTNFTRDGTLTPGALRQLWVPPAEPPLQFLKDVDLVTEVGDLVVVPLLLADEHPSWLWSLLPASKSAGDVRRIFSYHLLKMGLFARFVARFAAITNPIRVWRNLLVSTLKDDATTYITVECQAAGGGSGVIDVRARGLCYKEALRLCSDVLAPLTDGMDCAELLPSFCVHCDDTHSIARDELELAAQQGRVYYGCPNGFHTRIEVIAPELEIGQPGFTEITALEQMDLSRARGRLGTQEVHIKRLTSGSLDSAAAARELWACCSLNHANIVTCFGLMRLPPPDDAVPCVIREWMAHGSLDSVLGDVQLSIEWRLVMRIASDVAEALRFAHQAHPCVVHGALTPRRVMLASLDAGAPTVAKLSGFLPNDRLPSDDVRAFGDLMVSLLREVAIPKWCPVPLASLIQRCWNPEASPSFREIRFELLEIDSGNRLTLGQMKSIAQKVFPPQALASPAPRQGKDGSLTGTGILARLEEVAAQVTASPGTRRKKKVLRKKKGVLRKKKKGSVTGSSPSSNKPSSSSPGLGSAAASAEPSAEPSLSRFHRVVICLLFFLFARRLSCILIGLRWCDALTSRHPK